MHPGHHRGSLSVPTQRLEDAREVLVVLVVSSTGCSCIGCRTGLCRILGVAEPVVDVRQVLSVLPSEVRDVVVERVQECAVLEVGLSLSEVARLTA
jgi:hypothetical protein